MSVNFIIRGRLGNAIFRYMASAIISIYFSVPYSINSFQGEEISDKQFLEITNDIINRNKIEPNIFLKIKNGVNMTCFYQHDLIYKLYKNQIKDIIINNPSHYILTDGIKAGDGNHEKFYVSDILNTPNNFNKIYKNVLHIRLEDFVEHNLYIDKNRIIELLNTNIINEHLCIVCKKPVSNFEFNYIKYIVDYLDNRKILFTLEHNDPLTDYYIMKECSTLICSKSTLSWCAAFFSDKIIKCYMPDYEITNNSTCKSPIDNTELY